MVLVSSQPHKNCTDRVLTGKKQLNQLITLLDKEGGIRGSHRNADIALRSTRAKREAEEAGASMMSRVFASSIESYLDKDYRKAVHWLETLRIRRVKILEGGYNVSQHHTIDRYHERYLRRA